MEIFNKSSYWQPHITIAFFDDKNFEKFGKNLLKQSLKFKFTLNEITLFFFDKTDWHSCNVYPLMR